MTFKCPHCEQELEVDSSAAGVEIECPACGETFSVPEATPGEVPAVVVPVQPAYNPINTSAAAKEEKHYSVPVTDKPPEVLIKKAARPLQFASKESDRQVRVRTFKHSECYEVGKDHFDEFVSDFLDKVGQDNIVSITPINYSHVDMASQKLLTDFGIIVVYKG